jgi:secreted trypsin-like serine protease
MLVTVSPHAKCWLGIEIISYISYPSLFLLVSGDSGGPLLMKGNTDDKDVQVGIVSW